MGYGRMSDDEGYSPGECVAEEMKARGWSSLDVARRMGGDVGMNLLCVDMLIANAREPNLLLDDEMARQLGLAFEVSSQFFVNLERMWKSRAHRAMFNLSGEDDERAD